MKNAIILPWIVIAAIGAGCGIWFLRAPRDAGPHDGHTRGNGESYNCAMHPQYISGKPGNCPICGMKLTRMDKGPDRVMGAVPALAGDMGTRVHIDSAMAQNMGVRIGIARKRDMRTAIRANGKVVVDESKLVIVSARVTGYAEKLFASITGQKVMAGQPLLEIYSPDLVGTQEEYLQALRYGKDAADQEGAGSGDLAESARRRLLNWGISRQEIATLEKLGHSRSTLAIASPVSGVVLEKMIVQGQSIAPGMALYKIADLSKVWVVANIYQRDLAIAKTGAAADVELSYLTGKSYQGRVAFISPVLDGQSRTAEVRIEVANTGTLDFKPEMLVNVTIRSAPHLDAVAVPEQAIIHSGRRDLAIVAMGRGYFEPREVKLGISADDYVEIVEGIREGERIVVSSQFLIDSESNLKTAIQQMRAATHEDSTPTPDSGLGRLPMKK